VPSICHVCVHRFDRPDDYFVYPIRFGSRPPGIVIPLLPGDPAVQIDLQAVLDRCYDTGQYRRRVHYGEHTPGPSLPAEQAEWVQRLLREHGIVQAVTSS